MTLVIKIWIAYVLDLIFGDPQNIIHPVQIIGKMINIGEKSLLEKKYKSDRKYKFFAGMILNITVISLTYGITYLIRRTSENSIILTVAEIYLMYTVFSINSLAREGNRVYNILKEGNIERARKDLSYLVSRDTGTMDEKMIIRSTMETISENTVDGIVAPMMYMFLGGLPLSMTYKAINTFDSMVGYKNEKYMDFGKFSAKLDDVANFIPARITGILIVIASMILGYDYKNSLKIFIRDRKNHSSPNSGHAEAGVAGALGVQFGGRVSYFGKEVDKPVIGNKIKESMRNIIMDSIGLFIIISGVKSSLESNRDITVLIYLIVGAIIGQIIDIDLQIKKLSIFIENKFSRISSISYRNKNSLNSIESEEKEFNFAKGFSVTTILYCIGAMAIMGSINSGLTGDDKILNIKAVLDGATAIVFASIYGVGTIFSAFSALIYQGLFFLFARQIKDFLTPNAITDLNFLGGIMICGLGINIVLKKNIKVANMLPSIFIPIIVEIFVNFFSHLF